MADDKEIKKPSLFWLLTESGRAILEYGTFLPYNALKKESIESDRHPVMVLPGFMATDYSTAPLRKFINKLGYEAVGWGEGRNYARENYLGKLLNKLENQYLESGQEISLIGWSLGGIFARQLAKERPDLVRQVITLGSPFGGVSLPNNAVWIYRLLTKGKITNKADQALLDDIPKPAPVPTTAIYTKEDGVVPWEVCLEKVTDEWHQNIQVRGSHLGLGVNPAVMRIIEDRLKYGKENWTHFSTDSYVQDLLFYPSLRNQEESPENIPLLSHL